MSEHLLSRRSMGKEDRGSKDLETNIMMAKGEIESEHTGAIREFTFVCLESVQVLCWNPFLFSFSGEGGGREPNGAIMQERYTM